MLSLSLKWVIFVYQDLNTDIGVYLNLFFASILCCWCVEVTHVFGFFAKIDLLCPVRYQELSFATM